MFRWIRDTILFRRKKQIKQSYDWDEHLIFKELLREIRKPPSTTEDTEWFLENLQFITEVKVPVSPAELQIMAYKEIGRVNAESTNNESGMVSLSDPPGKSSDHCECHRCRAVA